jgi:phosphoribosylformimino-5-aminoimidazole carboxamide ribotide isomerase
MLVIPAIDIIDGECVRLFKGNFNLKKSYSTNPVEVAQKWKEMGAEWLHIIDLDGAKYGAVKNLKTAIDIRSITGLRIEFGGGIRDLKNLDLVTGSGIDRAIIGTRLLEDESFFEKLVKEYAGKFIISIDFDSEGFIYKNGWQSKTALNVFDFASVLERNGIKEIIVTNISRDGTLSGVDTGPIERLLQSSGLRLIVAGGVLDIYDISKLKSIEKKGITGVIIGKALYEDRINLKEAIEISGRQLP